MIVSCQDVSRRYGRTWALRRINLDIEAGESVFLQGPNGAGKTTLLRLMGTPLAPTVGTLQLFDTPVKTNLTTARMQIGFLGHDHFFYSDLTARENLNFCAAFKGTPGKVPDVLQRVGLSEHQDKPVRALSAGMKRRLGLARVLLSESKLVLLDEPFGQLDPGGVKMAVDVVRELRASGVTIVLSSHNHDLGAELSDRTLRLCDGALG